MLIAPLMKRFESASELTGRSGRIRVIEPAE